MRVSVDGFSSSRNSLHSTLRFSYSPHTIRLGIFKPVSRMANVATSSARTTLPTSPDAPPPVKVQYPPYSWRAANANTRLLYIRDATQANCEVSKLRRGPVGFDLEWRPTFVKGHPENPVALVQIANQDAILLIQVSAMQGKIMSVYTVWPYT